MMDVTTTSWHTKIPTYMHLFYTFNSILIVSGVMDPMMPIAFGTSLEMMPVITGPAGDFAFLSSIPSFLALAYLLWPEGKSVEQLKTNFLVRDPLFVPMYVSCLHLSRVMLHGWMCLRTGHGRTRRVLGRLLPAVHVHVQYDGHGRPHAVLPSPCLPDRHLRPRIHEALSKAAKVWSTVH